MNDAVNNKFSESSSTLSDELLDVVLLKQMIQTQAVLAKAHFDLDAFIQLVVDEMQILTPATGAVVELVDGDEMVYRAVAGTVTGYLGLRLPINNSISGLCVTSNSVLLSNDTEHDNRVNAEACRKVSALSLVVAPLVYEGRTMGVLKILSKYKNGFKNIHVQTLQIMAGFIASALSNQLFYQTKEKLLRERAEIIEELKKTQEKLHYLAHHDALTRLSNRTVFNQSIKDELAHAKKNDTTFAIMYLDIDHFKNINDTYGHHVGDELLKIFSKRLLQTVRKDDLVVRIGGDEFILLLRSLHTPNDAILVAQKIIEKMNQKFKLTKDSLDITTSIGIAFYAGERLKPKDLIKKADDALFQAKEAGRNTYRLFES